MGDPGFNMGLVTTWRVGVDFDTITVLSQLISTFCRGSWARADKVITNIAKTAGLIKKRNDVRYTHTPIHELLRNPSFPSPWVAMCLTEAEEKFHNSDRY